MNYTKFFKKQTSILVIAVIAVVLSTLGLTYAVFMQVDTNTDNQVVETGSLIVTYNKGTTLTAQMLPMSNASGLAQAGYSFTVQNTGTLPAAYTIKLHNNIDAGVPNQNNYLAHNQLYISLDGGTPQLISTLSKEDPSVVIENNIIYIMYEGNVGKAQTNSHNVKLWIKEDADESIVGKGINLIVEVEAVVAEDFFEGELTWHKNWGSLNDDYFNALIQIDDGGYIVVGTSSGNVEANGTGESLTGFGLLDGVIIKYNSSGNVVWQKNWGGTGNDGFNSIIKTNDGGYIVAGFSASSTVPVFENGESLINKGSNDAIIIKYDSNGNVLWQKNWGAAQADNFYEIHSALDGGFIAIASSTGNIPASGSGVAMTGIGGYDGVIVKYDGNGTLIWQKNWGSTSNDWIESIIPSNDGGYIAVARSVAANMPAQGSGLAQTGLGGGDSYFIKFNQTGSVVWQKVWGGNNFDCFDQIQKTSDGGYVVVGYTTSPTVAAYGTGEALTNSGGDDNVIIKLDNNGDIVWQKLWGKNSYERFASVLQTNDGGYIAVGLTGNLIFAYPVLVKYDNTGIAEWEKIYSGSTGSFSNIIRAAKGGYIVVGNNNGNVSAIDKGETLNGIGGNDAYIAMYR